MIFFELGALAVGAMNGCTGLLMIWGVFFSSFRIRGRRQSEEEDAGGCCIVERARGRRKEAGVRRLNCLKDYARQKPNETVNDD